MYQEVLASINGAEPVPQVVEEALPELQPVTSLVPATYGSNVDILIDGLVIRQDDAGRYCLNDLHRASGGEKKHSTNYWLGNQQTKELIAELADTGIPVSVQKGGTSQGTYVVKELVYAYAMWISPEFFEVVRKAFNQVPEAKEALQAPRKRDQPVPFPQIAPPGAMLAPTAIAPQLCQTTGLIVITDGEPRTTTLAIAEGTGVEHASVIKLVRNYQVDIEEFGRVGFEIQPFETAGGTQKREVALLNEQQATLIIAFMRNTEIVVDFKKRLVKAFYELKGKVEDQPAALVPTNLKDALK